MKFAVIKCYNTKVTLFHHCLLRNVKTLQQVLISTLKVTSERTCRHPGMAFNPSTILNSAFNTEVIFLVSMSWGIFNSNVVTNSKKFTMHNLFVDTLPASVVGFFIFQSHLWHSRKLPEICISLALKIQYIGRKE